MIAGVAQWRQHRICNPAPKGRGGSSPPPSTKITRKQYMQVDLKLYLQVMHRVHLHILSFRWNGKTKSTIHHGMCYAVSHALTDLGQTNSDQYEKIHDQFVNDLTEFVLLTTGKKLHRHKFIESVVRYPVHVPFAPHTVAYQSEAYFLRLWFINHIIHKIETQIKENDNVD